MTPKPRRIEEPLEGMIEGGLDDASQQCRCLGRSNLRRSNTFWILPAAIPVLNPLPPPCLMLLYRATRKAPTALTP